MTDIQKSLILEYFYEHKGDPKPTVYDAAMKFSISMEEMQKFLEENKNGRG